ncbi:E3 ubiquitin-protein ligase listerin [Aphis craccivora]|uniref:E3 ubiquitin-protein ligase listerin n=1 Tax=Aphis craccivora TaxID=307492 RepID=A0A6G0Z2Y9_APHCR|nr:E3 ubiquitin-protein ligase listerin [Aphis craccivora]
MIHTAPNVQQREQLIMVHIGVTCKSLEFMLFMLSLSNEELINLYNSALSKHSDSPNFIHIIQVTLIFFFYLNLKHSIDLLFNLICNFNIVFKMLINL